VFDILAILEIRVDKTIEFAILEFDSPADRVPPLYSAHGFDDVEAVLHQSLVIVGQFKNEEVLEYWVHKPN